MHIYVSRCVSINCYFFLLTGQCNNVVAADIVFLVDGSSSIGRTNFVLVKNFMAGIVKPFARVVGPSGIRFGTVQYSDTARSVKLYVLVYLMCCVLKHRLHA